MALPNFAVKRAHHPIVGLEQSKAAPRQAGSQAGRQAGSQPGQAGACPTAEPRISTVLVRDGTPENGDATGAATKLDPTQQ